jgi:uncharacterized membrane protein
MIRAPFAAIALLSLAVAAYAVIAYTALPLGATVHPDMRAAFAGQKLAVYAHVFGSAIALAIGPLQFWTALRQARPRLHRALGLVYLGAGVTLGGLAGLFLAPRAYGGLASSLGFACLALAWLYTASHAYGAAMARDFDTHRRWMMRNFALTFAAVTLRLMLPASALAGIPFEAAYPVIAWLCWVPNLVVAEMLIARLVPFAKTPTAA